MNFYLICQIKWGSLLFFHTRTKFNYAFVKISSIWIKMHRVLIRDAFFNVDLCSAVCILVVFDWHLQISYWFCCCFSRYIHIPDFWHLIRILSNLSILNILQLVCWYIIFVHCQSLSYCITMHIIIIVKNQGVFVKHWLCPRRQQSPKKLFLEQRSKSRSHGHWPWCHLKGHH